MDKSWMNASRISQEYDDGVKNFINFAKNNLPGSNERLLCPCKKCCNQKRLCVKDVYDDLICHGINPSYTKWIWHGESNVATTSNMYVDNKENEDDESEDQLDEMFRDVGEEFIDRSNELDELLKDSKLPLWPGCSKYTRLSAVLKLFNLKAGNGWSDKSFTALLEILKGMLPDDNELPKSTYDAKKILCPMGMGYKKIHVCPNDCILFRNDYKDLHACPICGASRFKTRENVVGKVSLKSPPAKVMWYLPILSRFKRMFANPSDAKNLTWHADQKISDGKLRHPADSRQWTTFDNAFPEFGHEPRNLRLGLCTDGMNPHGNLSSKHSSWPVMLVIYNLPPWLCMKRKYILLCLMISRPKQPGNDIDVFLAPLIEDLKSLWDEGALVFDAYRKESFKLHAMLFCTINDFPAYGNLSGYSVKGHKACPICEDNTCYHQLVHGRKTVYMGHRRFLDKSDPYRRLKKAFNGVQDYTDAPQPLIGIQVYERVECINVTFGKTKKLKSQRGKRSKSNVDVPSNEKSPWKKKSIFFDLPYWKTLDVRHSIDVMHVEKNMCDSLVGTLLDIKGKTKDGLNARLDLIEMGIRPTLAPRSCDKKTYLPPAAHTLSRKEKISFCECLRGVKVPQWYSSNISRFVNIQDLKLVGLKSHDCHALMQQLLPVAVRGILPKKLRYTVIRLCFFFNAICAKVIDLDKLDELQNGIIVTLCQLEMHFPPAFFDIMVHLLVHLVREIRECGPAYLRWMYPFERYMKVLKGYVRNRYRPEASIVESYIAEEVIEFCTEYLAEVEAIGVPKYRHEGRIDGKGHRHPKMHTMSCEDVEQVYLYILHNTSEVEPYLDEHKALIREQNPRRADMWIVSEHNRTFICWFKNKVLRDNNVSETIRWLAHGPSMQVVCYNGYDINGFSFYTKAQDEKSTMQNSGVSLVANSMHFSSSKDRNPVIAQLSYYGVIEEI
ncbi:uncharacterized protein LOC116020223 [Ipomoea triloba]|uniref:uncharacterized protein LOC116020223 n=1 Tax=Ipomoea triloba TaxID=35885 RepID=UPI00125D035D|nr:uncharacterized protein LOC116020223 [Ipomoea triloba]